MLIDINNYLIYNILYFICNEDLFQINIISKYLNLICSDTLFKKKIYKRIHPIIFNVLDNYCIKCNMNKRFQYSKLIEYGYNRCHHIT